MGAWCVSVVRLALQVGLELIEESVTSVGEKIEAIWSEILK